MYGQTPLGRLDARAFGMLGLPRLDPAILEGFRALGDLTGTTSDAMDECRIAGVVPGSTLRPTDPKARLVAQAVTVLNQRREPRSAGACLVPFERAAEVLAVAQRLAEREEPGWRSSNPRWR